MGLWHYHAFVWVSRKDSVMERGLMRKKVIIFIWIILLWFYLFTLKNFFHHMPAFTPFCGMENQHWCVLWVSPQMSLLGNRCQISRLGPNPYHGLSSFATVFLSGSVTPLVSKSLPEQLTLLSVLSIRNESSMKERSVFVLSSESAWWMFVEGIREQVSEWLDCSCSAEFSPVMLGQSPKSL